MTSDQIKALLNEKYSDGDKCLIAFEVNEGTGSNSGRRVDAIALYLWPSLNYKMIGFEIKVSRADWLNEMKQPEKSLPLAQYCDEFYLVAPVGVLGIDELPKTWGFIHAHENGLHTKIKAPKRDPFPPTLPFMASLIRTMTSKYQDKSFLKAEIEVHQQKLDKRFDEQFKIKCNHLQAEVDDMRKFIRDFNQQSGLDLTKYSMGRIAEAVKALKEAKTRDSYINDMTNQIKVLESITENTKKSLEALKNISIE